MCFLWLFPLNPECSVKKKPQNVPALGASPGNPKRFHSVVFPANPTAPPPPPTMATKFAALHF